MRHGWRFPLMLAVLALLLVCALPAAGAEEAPAEWTVLFYICGSDLESEYGCASENLAEIATLQEPWNALQNSLEHYSEQYGVPLGERGRVNVLIETGGAKRWHAEKLGMQIRTDALQYWQFHPAPFAENSFFTLEAERPLASMARPETLTGFIRWGTENYPAKKYALVLWSHGGGSATGIFIDELFDREFMTLDLLEQSLAEGGTHFEAVLFDACMMANIETACAIQNHAKWMIASEELVAGKGTAVGEWLRELYYVPNGDGRLLGRWICDTTMIKYADDNDEQAQQLLTWSVINLSKIARLERNWDQFFRHMGVFYQQYPEILIQFASSVYYAEEYGTHYENMFDMGDFLFAPVMQNTADSGMQREMQEALVDAVDYCVRGNGRPAARGLSFCFATDFSEDELDVYALNCPSANYLALLDAISPWTAPDRVYEQVERIPDQADNPIYKVTVEKTIWTNGSPAFRVTAGEFNVRMVQYSLYRRDEGTGQTIRLGQVPVYFDPGNAVFRTYDVTRWPAIDGQICQIEVQNMVSRDESGILYNIPIQMDSRLMNMRCIYWYEQADYQVFGLWNGYDSNSSQYNRNVKSLAQVAGQEYRLVYELMDDGKNAKPTYTAGPAMTMYRAIHPQEVTLPPGTYYIQFALYDMFMRPMEMDIVPFTWDGEKCAVAEGVWEGTETLTARDYYEKRK